METKTIEAAIKAQIEASPKLKILSQEDMLSFGVTGLNEEAGEVAGLLCREVYKKVPMAEERWVDELGDAMWYLVCATMAKGYTLEDLWNYNTAKLTERYGLDRAKEYEQLRMEGM